MVDRKTVTQVLESSVNEKDCEVRRRLERRGCGWQRLGMGFKGAELLEAGRKGTAGKRPREATFPQLVAHEKKIIVPRR